MTLQWTFVATVLYVEIFLISVLLLPFISPTTWQKVFRSRPAQWLSSYSKVYFIVFIAILVLLFAESVRETIKYSETIEEEELRRYPEAETTMHMKLFRAQRNLYIAGGALFLWFILRRLTILIANEATLRAESEASFRQAQSATAAAQAMLNDQSQNNDNKKNEKKVISSEEGAKGDQTMVEKELAKTQTELEKTKEELYKSKVEFETMKKQAESTNKEYDRLLLEHEKVQNQLAQACGDDKKDN